MTTQGGVEHSSGRSHWSALGAHLRALLAVAAPLLLAATTVPDPVFLNQAVALGAWGLWCAYRSGPVAPLSPSDGWKARLSAAIFFVLALLAGGAGHSAAAFVLVAVALTTLATSRRADLEDALMIGRAWWIAGLGCVVVAMIQFFAPVLADSWLVAASSVQGRAVGNMRQPNHLGTALLCSIVMTAWLWRAGRLSSVYACASVLSMVFAIALSASRTAALSLGVLVIWAGVDKSLSRAARTLLALTPLAYAAAWGALLVYASSGHAQYLGSERLLASGDISSSRFAIWRNTLTLIEQQPLGGVGWGNFNFAWTFTSLPDRPTAFFDHAHNAPLQLAAEVGVPVTVSILAGMCAFFWSSRGAWKRAVSVPEHPARPALVMLGVLSVHSVLEYPLWYAYFLLPAAWAMGMLVSSGRSQVGFSVAGTTALRGRMVALAGGTLMLVGAAYSVWDHSRIEAIFDPAPGAPPLAERIAEGRKSWLFGHHADYAAVTTEPRDQRLASFRRPLHNLVDARLLIAYIEALRVHGEDERALYAAQRLREFRRPDAQAYFKDCTPENAEPPFQCDTRPLPLTWRDMEP